MGPGCEKLRKAVHGGASAFYRLRGFPVVLSLTGALGLEKKIVLTCFPRLRVLTQPRPKAVLQQHSHAAMHHFLAARLICIC
jgi:hypothetical protein